jgi:hypothetical protein
MQRKILVLLGICGVILGGCTLVRPQQLNMILIMNPADPGGIDDIVKEVARSTNMKISSRDMSTGPPKSKLRIFEIYNDTNSIVIQSVSDQECSSTNGPQELTYTKPTFSVTIADKSSAQPPAVLKKIAMVIENAAKARGGRLLNQEYACQNSM